MTVPRCAAIAPLLDMPAAEVAYRLESRRRTNVTTGQIVNDTYAVLKAKFRLIAGNRSAKRCSSCPCRETCAPLRAKKRDYFTALQEQGIYTESIDDQLRVYPNQTLAAHVLGCVGTG